MCQPPRSTSRLTHSIGLLVPLFVIGPTSHAVVVEFTNGILWEAAAGDITSIQFTGFPSGTIITDQYLAQGILLTDGDDIIINNGEAFPDDGSGLRGGNFGINETIAAEFDGERFSIGLDYPGAIQIELYFQNTLIYTSSQFGGVGGPFFAGLVSTEPFDAAILIDWVDDVVFIDNFHFGVPVPGVLPLMLICVLTRPQRRRD